MRAEVGLGNQRLFLTVLSYLKCTGMGARGIDLEIFELFEFGNRQLQKDDWNKLTTSGARASKSTSYRLHSSAR